MKIKSLLLVLALGLAAAFAWAWAPIGDAATEWVRVERRDLILGVPWEGELEAIDSAQLGPPQVSEIFNYKIAFLAPEGAQVRAGQPVLGFDTNELRQTLQEKLVERDSADKELEKQTTDLEIEQGQQQLQLAEAKARLRRAQLKIDVPAELLSRHELAEGRIEHQLAKLEIGSLEEGLRHLEKKTAAVRAALRERRDQAAARVVEIEQQIEQMMVRAPRPGTVIYVSNRNGEKKKVGDSVWRAEKVVEIPDLSRMRARGEIAESAAGRVQVGQSLSFELDAYLDRQYHGTVRAIGRTVQRQSRWNPRKIVKLDIALEETDGERMRPGMRVRGEIETERLPAVLTVPVEAVALRPQGAVVYVRSLFGVAPVSPTLGRRGSDSFEVLDGLEEGDQVRRGAPEASSEGASS